MNNVSKIPMFDKLNRFIRKYYANQLIKGSIYAFTMLSLYFILISDEFGEKWAIINAIDNIASNLISTIDIRFASKAIPFNPIIA